MLIEFSVENFRSFKDFTTFSMVAAKPFKEHSSSHLIHTDLGFDLLKSAVFYGNNASGKSNFLQAMGFMKATIMSSFRDALLNNEEKRLFPLEKFALNTKSERSPSTFEVTFIQEGVKYRYGFELDFNQVISEWLYHTTSKEVYLFKRTGQTIKVNKSSFEEGLGREDDVKENVLFLSYLAHHKKSATTSKLIAWFSNFNFINGINDSLHKRYTIQKLKSDANFLLWVSHFIRYLEISKLVASEEDLNALDIDVLRYTQKDDELVNLLSSIQKIQFKQGKRDLLLTYHRQYDEHNLMTDVIPFNFEQRESEGTKKLLYLLGPWYDSLKNGKILVIDELDSRLHSHLTARLIGFFQEYNDKAAQLICAVHDVALLNRDMFRRDQIWFVEKNQFGASELFSLADFKSEKVRNKSAFDKNYMEGKYGAIPYFELDDQLKALLYGE